MSHALIPNTWEAEARLIYRATSRTAKEKLSQKTAAATTGNKTQKAKKYPVLYHYESKIHKRKY